LFNVKCGDLTPNFAAPAGQGVCQDWENIDFRPQII